jgi:hypothetical protein
MIDCLQTYIIINQKLTMNRFKSGPFWNLLVAILSYFFTGSLISGIPKMSFIRHFFLVKIV